MDTLGHFESFETLFTLWKLKFFVKNYLDHVEVIIYISNGEKFSWFWLSNCELIFEIFFSIEMDDFYDDDCYDMDDDDEDEEESESEEKDPQYDDAEDSGNGES